MLVKIEARILIFSGTDFYFPSTSVPPGTFLGSAAAQWCSANSSIDSALSSRACTHVQQFVYRQQFVDSQHLKPV